jgi:hypothetical protein
VLIKEVAMNLFVNAVSMPDVENQKTRSPMRHLAAVLMIGAVVAAAGFTAPAFAQQGNPPPHARPHAAGNQPGVNAKHVKPAPAAGPSRSAHQVPVRAEARRHVPVHVETRRHPPVHVETRRYTPVHVETRRYTPVHVERGPRFAPPPPVAYRFRDSDRSHLQRHYQSSLRLVRVDRRPVFTAGRVIPVAYRPQVAVLPAHVHRHLPPPPRGYRVGYYQGYSVVYDPVTFTILSVLDLLTR